MMEGEIGMLHYEDGGRGHWNTTRKPLEAEKDKQILLSEPPEENSSINPLTLVH